MESLKVTADNHAAIAAISTSLRRRADQREPSFSTRQIIDVCFPGTIVKGRMMPTGIHELVCVDDAAFRSHRAPHVIFYSRKLSTDRQRHAIAHALAHIIFDGGRRECARDSSHREDRCDRFADELLAPLDFLFEYVCAWPSRDRIENERYLDQVDQIASHFHVPTDVIKRQISRLPL